MKRLLIKVCGLTEPANIQAISALGVDMLGFIFYPPSPRTVEGRTTPTEIAAMPVATKKTGVFVNETVAKMLAIATEYGLDKMQLHGQESPETCRTLRSRFQILKAFPIATQADFEQTKAYEGACDYYVFDTKGPSHGGNGFAFDWSILDAYTGDTPFLLSGGISVDDADKIKGLKHPKLAGLDLNSRFETSAGVKNVLLVEQFLEALMAEA